MFIVRKEKYYSSIYQKNRKAMSSTNNEFLNNNSLYF